MEFRHHADLVEHVQDAGASHQEETLDALMALGRAAGLITAKYHVFAKPPREVFWCRTCGEVMRGRSCPDGHDTVELQFCRACHHPFVEAQDDEETLFTPVGEESFDGVCPGCRTNRIRLTDITVPTPTLLSFMLTELCRSMPSNKTLVFSDSRATAESVSNEIVGTEYGLTAETLYVKELMEQGGSGNSRSLFFAVSNTLREQYWQPLRQNTPDEETDANDILVEMLNEIEPHARLPRCQHLRESGLVTPAWIYDQDDAVKTALAHEVFNLFVSPYP
ncbi:MAG: ATP-dependent helicase, partial [Candidatus Nanohaloarchaea archaeon]|nr:ATP-dependent helicase [Candidatus Nanohaloarchaea archaeon]